MDSFNSSTAKIVISPDNKYVEISDGITTSKSYSLSPEGITIVKKKGKLKVKAKSRLKNAFRVTKHKAKGKKGLSLIYDDLSQRLVVGSTDISSGRVVGSTDISSGRVVGSTDISSGLTDSEHFIGLRGQEEIGISLVNFGDELTVESGTVRS